MAIYHFEAKVITRGTGRSVVTAAAYASCSQIYNDYDGVNQAVPVYADNCVPLAPALNYCLSHLLSHPLSLVASLYQFPATGELPLPPFL